MFKVTLSGPVLISNGELEHFLCLVGTATVEPADEDLHKFSGNGQAESPAPAAAPKPRGRPAKPTPPPGAPAEPPAQNSQVTDVKDLLGGTPDRAELLTKFTALVDSDYDKALEALTSFKVQRFSDIPDDQLGAFAAAIA